MENSAIVRDFLSYLKFEKHFSEHTAKCYGADLTQFAEYLCSKQSGGSSDYSGMSGHSDHTATAVAVQAEAKLDQKLLAVDVNSVREYMALLNDKQYSKSTIARKLATLRSFYK
ncbi:MAG: site-specific integrase, partial [Phycisphaerae bacterium]